MSRCVVLLVALAATVAGLRAPVAFDAEGMMQLSEETRRAGDVGYRLRARVLARPAWVSGDDLLLEMRISGAELSARMRQAGWEPRKFPETKDGSPAFALIRAGVVEKVYLDPTEPIDMLNFKKSLISLFQFQTVEGEHNETDISGECEVFYETISEKVFRKIKSACASDSALSVRRLTSYERGAGRALVSVTAEEVFAADGLQARGLLSLRARPGLAPAPAPPAPSLDAALAAMPRAVTAASIVIDTSKEVDEDVPTLSEALEAARWALRDTEPISEEGDDGEGPGAGEARDGEAEGRDQAAAADVLLDLVEATQRAKVEELVAVLENSNNTDILRGLSRILGLAGSAGALAAARRALSLSAPAPLLPHALLFLDGLALSAEPQESVISEALSLGARRVLAAAALGAAGAAAGRGGERGGRAGLRVAVREHLATDLDKCKDEECRVARLHALGNMRCTHSEALFIRYAERGTAAEALAAIRGLGAAASRPGHALQPTTTRRLERLALSGVPFPVRAAALLVAIDEYAAAPPALAPLAHALAQRAGPVERELQRLLWQRLEATGGARELAAALPRWMRDWAGLWEGTSLALRRRAAAWEGAAREGRLETWLAASQGLLRRAHVTLTGIGPDLPTEHGLTVELWAQGLAGLAGAPGQGEGEEEEEISAGLAFTVADARFRDIVLFKGQSELLSHVWAGTGSTPTSVLRALRPLSGESGAAPALPGCVLRVRRRAAATLALHAQAVVSLWSRSAALQLAAHGGGSAHTRLHVQGAHVSLSAHAHVSGTPALRLSSHADFYSAPPDLCVRTHTDDVVYSRIVQLQSAVGSPALTLRRHRTSRHTRPGRTLSLSRASDLACDRMTLTN